MKEFFIWFFGISGIITWGLVAIFAIFNRKRKIVNEDYEEMCYCDKCHRDTIHLIHGDNNHDWKPWKMCLTCRETG